MPAYFAHSGKREDKSDWQPLHDHLAGVAALAAESASPLRLGHAARLAGWLHDAGKYAPQFQRRLEGGPSVDHSTAGAKIALDLAARGQRPLAELVAYAVLGHHAGLPNRDDASDGSFEARLAAYGRAPDGAAERELHARLPAADFGALPPGGDAFGLSLLGRMLFSCLVDADFKDTERFYAGLEGAPVDRAWPDLQAKLPELQERFEAYMRERPAEGPLNALRRDILAHVRGRAGEAPGLFTLTVPTGGGKTLTSLAFALDHARAHGLRRIIYAIPFTSIIDQTVQVFGDVLGADHVLAHHSAIEEERERGEFRGRDSQGDKRRLAMEDWAAPVVVTTNVQLFESLFAARPSRARKLHNIAGSVIVLDEAQTLPRPLLKPALRMIEALASLCGCSVVLCTATQPAFDRRNLEGGLALEGRELAPDPQGLARRLRRATLRDAGELDNEALAAALAGEHQGLVIVNSRKHALDLYRAAQAVGLDGLVHLTTRQCAAHRRPVLDDVRARLKDGAPCRVVATSLVEAGVDLDFPRVWRAKAGLDQIVQAAGRCNREGRRDPSESLVTIFEAPDYPPPAEIRGLVEDMARMAAPDDWLSLQAIEAYFAEVYWRLGPALDAKRICERFVWSRVSGLNFAYRAVAEDFRMIESGMAPVVVRFDEKAEMAVDKLGVEAVPSGALARDLQGYVVQVPPRARRLLIDNGHVAFAHPKLRGEQFAILLNSDLYNGEFGLFWEANNTDLDYII
jgi:CRISPR-associated endonuclease/helicase Cas3